MQGGPHAFSDIKQSGAAAVHHAGFFQHVKQFRCMLEGQVHGRDEQVKILFETFAPGCCLDSFPENGQDGAFNRGGHGFIGRFDATGHRLFESPDIGFRFPGKPPGNAGKNTGEDDT